MTVTLPLFFLFCLTSRLIFLKFFLYFLLPSSCIFIRLKYLYQFNILASFKWTLNQLTYYLQCKYFFFSGASMMDFEKFSLLGTISHYSKQKWCPWKTRSDYSIVTKNYIMLLKLSQEASAVHNLTMWEIIDKVVLLANNLAFCNIFVCL